MDAQPPVRDRIFISYRRDDARGASGRLYDWLRIAFGRDRVFRDVSTLGVGKWRDAIDEALARSVACVAVVGPRWASADNLGRLADENDLVRHELITALTSSGLTLVPTLVEGAAAPATPGLPVELQSLFGTWNARVVTENAWEEDTRRLIHEIAQATGLTVGPDLETLLRDAGAAQRRIAELEETRHLQASQIEALQATVDRLTRELAEAPLAMRPDVAGAFAALAAGDTSLAEIIFEREYAAQRAAALAANQAAAEAARNVANLALLRDVTRAVAFYREALELAPDHAETHRLLGNALVLFGDLGGAQAAIARSVEEARRQGRASDEVRARNALGNVLLRLARRDEARTEFLAARALAQAHLAADPDSPAWRLRLSFSQIGLGDVLKAQGDGPGAVAAYRDSLALREALAAGSPTDAELQRNLSICHERIGDILLPTDRQEALAAYRRSLGIRQALAGRDPENFRWQQMLAIIHERIGDALSADDRPEALAAYTRSLGLNESLAGRDPANADLQSSLSASHERIGDVLRAQGDGAGALAAYSRSLALNEALAGRDPANTDWQRNFAVSHERIGDVLSAQGARPAALAAYARSLAIREALVARDPANTLWQRALQSATSGSAMC